MRPDVPAPPESTWGAVLFFGPLLLAAIALAVVYCGLLGRVILHGLS